MTLPDRASRPARDSRKLLNDPGLLLRAKPMAYLGCRTSSGLRRLRPGSGRGGRGLDRLAGLGVEQEELDLHVGADVVVGDEGQHAAAG